jgi:hypothetical protein
MIEELDAPFVDRVERYQTTEADYSVILRDGHRTQKYRVYYLKNLRDKWEWVDDSDSSVSFVMLKCRS